MTVEHVCAALIAASGATAVAVTLFSTTSRETVFSSDQAASDVEELTLTLGEGPSMDAFVDNPSLVADLESAESLARWPLFAPAAVAAGTRALFALPLRVGGIELGVLSLSRAQPGHLDREQLADGLVLADAVWALLLDGVKDNRLSQNARWSEQTGPQHPEVHQATGMITVQLGVTAEVAMVRLRAYAFAHDKRLSDVAEDVVARHLRFDTTDDD